MSSLFFGLNIATTALQANQSALNVTGNNLANASTVGYSRQRAGVVQGTPVQVGQQTFGSGVVVEGVERIQAQWLQRQVNQVQSDNSYYTALGQGIGQLETLLAEPSEEGLGAALTEFWNSWEALSEDPTDSSLRAQVVDQASCLATQYNRTVTGLIEAEQGFGTSVEDTVAQVNSLTAELAELNTAIAKAEAAGQAPNTLLDQRDLLVADITQKLGVEVEADGSYLNLKLPNGVPYLVNGGRAFPIDAETGPSGNLTDFRVGGGSVTLAEGELGALIELRDEISPGLRSELATLMDTVVSQVNSLHASGYDRDGNPGEDLFLWVDDATGPPGRLEVNPAVATDPDKIAAATSPETPGEGDLARQVADLRTQSIFQATGDTPAGYLSLIVQDLGEKGRQAGIFEASSGSILLQLEAQSQSISGVNVDEEMVFLIQYQRGYEAAARFLNTVDGLLDTLINEVGR